MVKKYKKKRGRIKKYTPRKERLGNYFTCRNRLGNRQEEVPSLLERTKKKVLNPKKGTKEGTG